MRRILTSCALASAACLATPALAGPVAEPPGDRPFHGLRAEAIAGYDIVKAGSSVDDDANADNDQSIDGLLYGAAVGYDFDLGGVIVGPEAEITGSTAKTSFNNGDFEGFGLGNVRTNRDIYVGGRIGFQMAPATMVYAKGGYTNAKFDVRGFDGTTNYRQDIDADGWRAGAGVEHMFTSQVYGKLEYRYSHYNRAEVDFNGTLPDSDRFKVDLDRHQVMAAMGFRF